MIQKIPDLMPRGLGSAQGQPKSEKKSGDEEPREFEELMKGPDRSERKIVSKPGRDSEGMRSEERDSATPQENPKPEGEETVGLQLSRKPTATRGKAEKSAKLEDEIPQASVNPQVSAFFPAIPPPAQPLVPVEPEGVASAPETSAEASALGASTAMQAPVEGGAAILAALDMKRANAVQTRQTAMMDFMSKMETQFGIKPEKILQAFSRLSEQAMMAPPEESMQELLSQLEIPTEKMDVAVDLYRQMVTTTKEADLNEKMATVDASLEALDQQLASLSPEQPLAPTPEMASLQKATPQKAQQALDEMNAQLVQLTRQMQPGEPIKERREKESAMAAGSMIAPKSAEALVATETPIAAPATAPVAATPVKTVAMPEMAAQGHRQAARESFTKSESSSQGEFSKVMKETSAPEITPELDMTSQAPVAQPTSTAPTFELASSSPTAAILDRPVTQDEEAANVKALLDQAKIAIKKGGGDIEMALKPEGVGRVKLKVSVEDGNVSVQMMTENDTAKKMLEKGLGELKSSLAEHQLKVESLKVDVGSEIKKQMDQNQDSAREQARQFASDFMGRFNDERRGFRQGLMERPSIRRSYGPGAGRPEMAPAPVVSSRASGGSGSKRLDLVA